MQDKKFVLQSTYGRQADKCQIFCHEDGTVGLILGFLESMEAQENITHDSARDLAQNILAILPAPAEAEPV